MIDTNFGFTDAFISATQAKRYGKAVCAMTKRNRFVHDVLCQLYDHPAMRGSYSSGGGNTILSRLIKFGPVGAGQYGPTIPLELPSHLLIVREACRDLNSNMKRTIDMTYGGNCPVEIVALEIHKPHSVVRNLLKEARPLIASYLAGRGVAVPKDEAC